MREPSGLPGRLSHLKARSLLGADRLLNHVADDGEFEFLVLVSLVHRKDFRHKVQQPHERKPKESQESERKMENRDGNRRKYRNEDPQNDAKHSETYIQSNGLGPFKFHKGAFVN